MVYSKEMQRVLELVKEKTGDDTADYQTAVLLGEEKVELAFIVPISYRKKNKLGFTKKQFEYNVIARYCPFTGVKLK